MYDCMYVCTYVCMYVCMYMYVCNGKYELSIMFFSQIQQDFCYLPRLAVAKYIELCDICSTRMKKTKNISQAKRPKETPSSLESNDKNTHKQIKATISRKISFQDTKKLISSSGQSVRYQSNPIQRSSEFMNHLSQEPTLLQNQVWHPEYQRIAIQRSSESTNHLSQESTLLQSQGWCLPFADPVGYEPNHTENGIQEYITPQVETSILCDQLSQEPTDSLVLNRVPYEDAVGYQPSHAENGIQEYVVPQVKTSILRDQLSQEPTDSLVLNRVPFADAVGYQPNHIENETQEFSAQRAEILRHLLKTAGKQSFTQSDEQEHQQATSKSVSSFEINIDLLPIKELLETITMEEITSLYSEAAETVRLMNLPTPKKSPQRL